MTRDIPKERIRVNGMGKDIPKRRSGKGCPKKLRDKGNCDVKCHSKKNKMCLFMTNGVLKRK